MNLKVGDKVKLNNNTNAFRHIGLPEHLMGIIVTVKRIRTTDTETPYEMRETGEWYFNDDTIEKVIPSKITNWRERIR